MQKHRTPLTVAIDEISELAYTDLNYSLETRNALELAITKLQRIKNEVEKPMIIEIFDLGVQRGKDYSAMGFLDGNHYYNEDFEQ